MSRILYDLHGNDNSTCPRYLDDKHARITVMGDSASGKTSFILRCVSDTFTDLDENGFMMEDIYHTKINLLNLSQDINIRYDNNTTDNNNNTIIHPIEVQMLDTAEFEIADFSDIRNEQILQSDAFILCFDLTNIESFLNLRTYQRRIERVRGMDDNVPILIAGTKSDLLMERGVDINDIIQSLTRFEINYETHYFEISSKLNINIKNILYRTLISIKDYKLEQKEKEKASLLAKDKKLSTPSSSSLSSSTKHNTPRTPSPINNINHDSIPEEINDEGKMLSIDEDKNKQRVTTKTRDLPNNNSNSKAKDACCIIC